MTKMYCDVCGTEIRKGDITFTVSIISNDDEFPQYTTEHWPDLCSACYTDLMEWKRRQSKSCPPED